MLVLGQVRSPGSYRLTETTRILDADCHGRGATDKVGQKLTLTRGGSTKEIDLGALTRLGLGNERLQAGDVLHIAGVSSRSSFLVKYAVLVTTGLTSAIVYSMPLVMRGAPAAGRIGRGHTYSPERWADGNRPAGPR